VLPRASVQSALDAANEKRANPIARRSPSPPPSKAGGAESGGWRGGDGGRGHERSEPARTRHRTEERPAEVSSRWASAASDRPKPVSRDKAKSNRDDHTKAGKKNAADRPNKRGGGGGDGGAEKQSRWPKSKREVVIDL